MVRAREHIAAGYRWVVDLDLEKFLDRVNHDLLMARVARRVKDKRVLRLIRRYLQAGLMEGGLVSPRAEGTPQGGVVTPRTQKITSESGSGSGGCWRPQAAVSSGSGVGRRKGMSDSNRITANQDLLHDQTKDFLPLHSIQSLGSNTEFAAKLR